jgi:hypothetical protein
MPGFLYDHELTHWKENFVRNHAVIRFDETTDILYVADRDSGSTLRTAVLSDVT